MTAVWKSHAAFLTERYPGERSCSGNLIILDRVHPIATVECDKCEFLAGVPVAELHREPVQAGSEF